LDGAVFVSDYVDEVLAEFFLLEIGNLCGFQRVLTPGEFNFLVVVEGLDEIASNEGVTFNEGDGGGATGGESREKFAFRVGHGVLVIGCKILVNIDAEHFAILCAVSLHQRLEFLPPHIF